MPEIRWGGIVLCGGHSSRMGQPKATLPFGPELMLQRLVRIVGSAVGPVVVVAAAEQQLPTLPAETLIARDSRPSRGPLEGLLAGLTALQSVADVAFVTGCDTPLLEPEFIRRMLELLEENEIAVPREGRLYHPLAAVYRTSTLPIIQELLQADCLRTSTLLERVRTREVPVELLRDADPELHSLRNLNDPQEYREALQRAGFAEVSPG